MSIRRWFRMFCEKTTCPGVQYLVMKHRSPVEKLFWILVFFGMTFIAIAFIRYTIVYVWIYKPSMIFIDNTKTPIQEIPFPAISICSLNQFRKWVWDRYENTNSSYWKFLQQYRSLFCTKGSYTPINVEHWLMEHLDFSMFKNIVHDSAVSCSEVFQTGIEWQNMTFVNICKFLQPMMSMTGICYKFNMLPVHQMLHDKYYQKYLNFFSKNYSYVGFEKVPWNLDDGYSSYSDKNDITHIGPARTGGVSYHHRLGVSLYSMPDEFLSCPKIDLADGNFLITLSNPSEFHTTTSHSIIASDTHTKFQITPFVRKINPDLVLHSPDVRMCYMNKERKLSIFKLYTESNCFDECWINMTIAMCGCVPYEMPFLITADLKICGTSKRSCTNDAKIAANTLNMQLKCNCMSTCSEINYEITISSDVESWDYLKRSQLVKNNSKGALVDFVYKDPHFTAYRSASILDVNSLIGAIGGILSLILGWSIINICEIMYVTITYFRNHALHNMFNN